MLRIFSYNRFTGLDNTKCFKTERKNYDLHLKVGNQFRKIQKF